MQIFTTLNQIKANDPCEPGWDKLLAYLNKTEADDEPLDLLTILDSNGVSHCMWAFRCTNDKYDSIYRLIAADFAESVLHLFEEKYPEDQRPRLAIQAARDFANGLITKEDLEAAAGVAAGVAARAAAWAAWVAAWAAAWAARGAEKARKAAGEARLEEEQKQRLILIKHLNTKK